MLVLACNKITKSFGIDIILNQITFSVNARHCVGVIGGNGAGKSTLLKIIAGILPMDDGDVYKAKDIDVAYLPQTTVLESNKTIWDELLEVFRPLLEIEKVLKEMESKMSDFNADRESHYMKFLDDYSKLRESFEEQGGYSYESYIRGVLIGLGFSTPEFNMSISHLSGGQKTRVALAKVLLEKPDLLLLDEPTNHLDLDAMQWLEDYLSAYPGTIMIVSHDRYFLNTLCDNILEIENRENRMYHGNYSDYQKQKSQLVAQQMKEYELQQKEILRQQEIIERYRSFNREKSIRAAESREKRLDKIQKVDKVYALDEVSFSFNIHRQSGRDVLTVDSLSKSFGDKSLFQNVSFDVHRGDRIALVGPNGCGKSTLFKIILDRISPSSGSVKLGAGVEVGYYDQELTSLNSENTVLEELWNSFPQMTETEIRNALAARLFKGDDVYKTVSSLSGGEKGHLVLTKLVLSGNNLLILDEPTNHLDMASREELERALAEYPGTILMVSHDRYFLNKIARRIIVMEAQYIREYLGNFDDYVQKKSFLEKQLSQSDADPTPTRSAIREERRRQRMAKEEANKQKETLAALERHIHGLEDEIKELEALMADPRLYDNIEKMLEVQQKYAELKNKLDESYSEWMDMA